MATTENKGPDTSFVEQQAKKEFEIRLQGYTEYIAAKKQLDLKYGVESLQAEIKRLNEGKTRDEKLLTEKHGKLLTAQAKVEQALYDQSVTRYQNSYASQSLWQRKAALEQRKLDQITHEQYLEGLLAAYDTAGKRSSDEYTNTLKEIERVKQAKIAAINTEVELQEHLNRAERDFYADRGKSHIAYKRELADLQKNKDVLEELELQISLQDGGATDEQKARIAATKQLIAALDASTKATKKQATKDQAKQKVTDDAAAAREQEAFDKEVRKEEAKRKLLTAEGWKETGKATLENSLKALNSAITDGLNQIDSKITTFYELQGKMNARLQGATDKNSDALSYESMTKNISKALKISGAVKQTDVITNLQKLIDAGVAYNVEGRAFLATIADNVASTFDATNPDLLRLIRLQQSETTAARLGLEASLTKLFNEYFSDSSYLSQAFDSVSNALMDVNATLSGKESVALEYVVQKWLGALSSLGLSDSAASTIAQGISYLGTGNVSALNNNSALQTLFAMSAGGSYSDLLVGGLTAESTNTLLRNMIVYLKSIADNTDSNMVTKSAYAELLGISVADLTAISNIKEEELNSLYADTKTYEDLYKETQNQLNQVTSRMHVSQIISNAVDNALTTAATGIGGNAGVYTLWKAINLVEGITGGIDIPSALVMGTGIDLNTKVTTIMKTAIAGISLIGQLMATPGTDGLSLDAWGFDQYTGRGSGNRKPLKSGSLMTLSSSSTLSGISSGSGADMQSASLASAADNAEDVTSITNKQLQDSNDIYQQIYEAIGKDTGTSAIEQLMLIQNDVHNIKENSSSQLVSQLVASSAVLVSNIGEAAASTVAEQSLGKNKGLSVILSGLTDETKIYFEQMMKTMLASAFAEQLAGTGASGEGGKSMYELFRELLANVNVTVTNDWFDNVLQRSAFS